MKTLLKCSSIVQDGDLVQFSGGTVERYAGGQFAGVASGRRDVQIIDPATQQERTEHVVVVNRRCVALARLDGSCGASGGTAYVSGHVISSTGTIKVGIIEPRPYPNSSDFLNEMVNLYVELSE